MRIRGFIPKVSPQLQKINRDRLHRSAPSLTGPWQVAAVSKRLVFKARPPAHGSRAGASAVPPRQIELPDKGRSTLAHRSMLLSHRDTRDGYALACKNVANQSRVTK